jgi:hypothetical protein
MQPEGLLLCAEEPATCPYLDPDQYIPRLYLFH